MGSRYSLKLPRNSGRGAAPWSPSSWRGCSHYAVGALSLVALVNHPSARPTIIAGTWDFRDSAYRALGIHLRRRRIVARLDAIERALTSCVGISKPCATPGPRNISPGYSRWLVYLLFVVGGSILTLQARRRTLVVYNVEPDHFEATLSEVFRAPRPPGGAPRNLWVGGVPLCEVEPFAGGRTVTLRWVSEDLLLFSKWIASCAKPSNAVSRREPSDPVAFDRRCGNRGPAGFPRLSDLLPAENVAIIPFLRPSPGFRPPSFLEHTQRHTHLGR